VVTAAVLVATTAVVVRIAAIMRALFLSSLVCAARDLPNTTTKTLFQIII